MKVYHVVKKTPGTRERERDREREREREIHTGVEKCRKLGFRSNWKENAKIVSS
jgi:hypothetical protein